MHIMDDNTPETDAELNLYFRHGEAQQISVPWIEFARKLERERCELRRMSVMEMMGENLNVKHHVTEWENRCLKAERERDEAREQIKELICISERAIALAEIDFENDKFGVVSELRDGLERIKEARNE